MKIDAAYIEAIIQNELRSGVDIQNVFGVDLTKCLIRPKKHIYNSAIKTSLPRELWTVFHETRGMNDYRIYFDEKLEIFGLAVKTSENTLLDIGSCGTFLQTLHSL